MFTLCWGSEKVMVAAAHLEVEDPVLYIAGQEHLALLPSQQQNTSHKAESDN